LPFPIRIPTGFSVFGFNFKQGKCKKPLRFIYFNKNKFIFKICILSKTVSSQTIAETTFGFKKEMFF